MRSNVPTAVGWTQSSVRWTQDTVSNLDTAQRILLSLVWGSKSTNVVLMMMMMMMGGGGMPDTTEGLGLLNTLWMIGGGMREDFVIKKACDSLVLRKRSHHHHHFHYHFFITI